VKVTFDSNVWGWLVSEPSKYPRINEKILNGAVSPYITEIALSLESIQRAARQKFFKEYTPSFTSTMESVEDGRIHGKFQFGPNTASHPGLAPILSDNLLRARTLGFKVIRMTNFGTVRSAEIPKEMLLTVESWDEYWAYAERLSDCSEFITSLGCGYHDYKNMKLAPPPASPNDLAKAVAEWVDGDSLSAHYAFGADVFCTNDRGVKAGARSVFYSDNLAKVKSRFGIVVHSPEEISQYSSP
jgi:hypothetical protein